MKRCFVFIVVILVSAVFLTCCKKEQDLTVCTALFFEENSFDVVVEESREISVTAEPVGTLDYNAVSFEVTNPKIAEIEYYEENICTIKGNKSGATILKALCGDQEAKCIVSVYEKDTEDLARKAVADKKRYYMYSLTYEIEKDNYICTSFIKDKAYDYEIKDGIFTVIRDNGIMVRIPVDAIYDFNFYEID